MLKQMITKDGGFAQTFDPAQLKHQAAYVSELRSLVDSGVPLLTGLFLP
jgi:hypothetical protein